MKEEFKNKLVELSDEIGIQLNEKQIEKFFKYMNLLLDWNKKINLTAITDMDDIILKHFIDSITILKYINGENKIIDVGTGAGFPGIPIAVMKSDVEITLLDSLNKRILFLENLSKELDLRNVEIIHGRAEDFGKNTLSREKYDIAVSRAVANMSTLVEYLLPFVKVGGICICMKGSEIEKELESAKVAIKELGGKIEKIDKFKLPDSTMERNIIIIKKEKETLEKYPRKAGIPSRQPIK